MIRPAADGGTIKKVGSERDIPIHSAIIERGFLDFVGTKGGGPLFYRGTPKKRPANDRPPKHASKSITNHLATWIREQGFRDPKRTRATLCGTGSNPNASRSVCKTALSMPSKATP